MPNPAVIVTKSEQSSNIAVILGLSQAPLTRSPTLFVTKSEQGDHHHESPFGQVPNL
jgi:hypothetical protein